MTRDKVEALKRDVGYRPDCKPWVGVDLDGTLAYYDGWKGEVWIGDPIPEMMDRVRGWICQGITVKIFTARAGDEMQKAYIRTWLREHDLPELEITNVKDWMCVELWDDRAVGVVKNQGIPCCGASR